MKRVRVYMGIMYYLFLVAIYVLAIAWMREGAKLALEPGDKAGILSCGLCWFLFCVYCSEIYDNVQGLRADLFDMLLSEEDW